MKLYTPNQADEQFDLTPMIDIVFLLIVFFMTVANILTAEKKPVEIPVAENSSIPEEAGSRQTLTVLADGTTFAGLREVSLQELTALVREGNETIRDYRVFLRADANTPHHLVRDVMKACADGGSFDIIFAVYQSDK